MPDKEAGTTPAVFGPPPAHPFVDDPGGEFPTDAHRRVLGHLPTPDGERTSRELLCQRINEDGGNPLTDPAEVNRILDELEAEGHLITDNGLRMTEAGLEAIQR
jgi:hypothetical protein